MRQSSFSSECSDNAEHLETTRTEQIKVGLFQPVKSHEEKRRPSWAADQQKWRREAAWLCGFSQTNKRSGMAARSQLRMPLAPWTTPNPPLRERVSTKTPASSTGCTQTRTNHESTPRWAPPQSLRDEKTRTQNANVGSSKNGRKRSEEDASNSSFTSEVTPCHLITIWAKLIPKPSARTIFNQ